MSRNRSLAGPSLGRHEAGRPGVSTGRSRCGTCTTAARQSPAGRVRRRRARHRQDQPRRCVSAACRPNPRHAGRRAANASRDSAARSRTIRCSRRSVSWCAATRARQSSRRWQHLCADLDDPVPIPGARGSASGAAAELLGATRERMVRELCEALEVITQSVPITARPRGPALGGSTRRWTSCLGDRAPSRARKAARDGDVPSGGRDRCRKSSQDAEPRSQAAPVESRSRARTPDRSPTSAEYLAPAFASGGLPRGVAHRHSQALRRQSVVHDGDARPP